MGFGADTDVRSKNGRTPLHEAAENGHLEIVRLLAGHHAYVDATTHRSNTPMLLALENRHTKVIELFASEFAANVNVKDNYGWALLHYLAHDGNIDTMRILMGFRADQRRPDTIRSRRKWTFGDYEIIGRAPRRRRRYNPSRQHADAIRFGNRHTKVIKLRASEFA